MLRIIGLDPGGTTGWCYVELEELTFNFSCGLLGSADHHLQLYNLLGNLQTAECVIACESFEYRNRARSGLELISRDYIGVATLFSQERDVSLFMQTASQAKGFVSDDVLKRLGFWQSEHKQRHAMDAARHALWWIINDRSTKGLRIKEKYKYSAHEILKKGWQL